MMVKNKYKLSLINLKKYIKSIKLKKNKCNYLLLKIKKREYNTIYKIYNSETKIPYYVKQLEIHDKKCSLIEKRSNKRDILSKIYYVYKICKIKNEITKYKAIKLMGDLYYECINRYKMYFTNYINIFCDLDKNVSEEISNSDIYIFEKLHRDHFGLGMYVRNKYVYTKNEDVMTIFGSQGICFADWISTDILNGYRFYKIGIFDIFR